jgi:hypothetical protein
MASTPISMNTLNFSKYCTKNPQVTINVPEMGSLEESHNMKQIKLSSQDCLFSSAAQIHWCEKVHVCPLDKKVLCVAQCKSDLAVIMVPRPLTPSSLQK